MIRSPPRTSGDDKNIIYTDLEMPFCEERAFCFTPNFRENE